MRDRKFFLLVIALENATQAELGYLSTSIDNLVDKYTRAGLISDQQALAEGINKLLDKFYKRYVDLLKTSVEKVGTARADQAIQEIIPILRKAGMFSEGIKLYQEVKQYGVDVAKRLMINGYAGETLNFRIKTLRTGSQKTVQNIIANGVADGKSAGTIAKLIRQYINPIEGSTKIAPYDEYRKRFGRPKVTPKGVPAGTVQYNALRIARTETAHIYRNATLDFYDGKEWIKGFGWYLSNRHPAPDICDEYAKQIYKTREDVPFAHPQCLCDVRPIIMTSRELRELKDSLRETANIN